MTNIYLIGMPSSGKSTIGMVLASLLGYRFFDTDKEIEKQEDKKIADIFATFGEDYFRQLEAKILRSIKPNSGLVISTGGGMPCFHENMAFLKTQGISIFLEVEIEVLAKRIHNNNHTHRPLVNQNLTEKELVENLYQRYQNRIEYYTQADLTLKGVTNAHHIIELLKNKDLLAK